MNEIKIVIDGLKELTEAVRVLAGLTGTQAAGAPAQAPVPVQAAVPVQAPYTQPVQAAPYPVQGTPNFTTAPVQAAPAGVMPAGGVVPTTAAAQAYTLEQLQVAAAGLTSSGKMPQVMGILQKFGIQAMTELPKERYGEFATALREAGAQI